MDCLSSRKEGPLVREMHINIDLQTKDDLRPTPKLLLDHFCFGIEGTIQSIASDI
jgi:hypothetical protein